MRDESAAIQVLLVDDHPLIRAGLKALIESEADMQVVGEAQTAEEVLKGNFRPGPDVVVLDLEVHGDASRDSIRRLTESGFRVLALASDGGHAQLLQVMGAGASGLVRKAQAERDLAGAIRVAAADGVFLYPGAAGLLLRGYRTRHRPNGSDPFESLTESEHEVMTHAAGGCSSAEIGRKLDLAAEAVERSRSSIMTKLGLDHPSPMLTEALRVGLQGRSPEERR